MERSPVAVLFMIVQSFAVDASNSPNRPPTQRVPVAFELLTVQFCISLCHKYPHATPTEFLLLDTEQLLKLIFFIVADFAKPMKPCPLVFALQILNYLWYIHYHQKFQHKNT